MTPTPRTVHQIAFLAAFGIASIALFDAATHGVTGHNSVFADDTDIVWLAQVGNVLHGLAYTAAVAVLVTNRRRIVAVNRVAAAAYWPVLVAVAILGTGFVLVMPFLNLNAMPVAAGIVATAAFAVMLLGTPVLGLSLLRAPDMRPGNVLLAAMLPVLGLTILIGLLAPNWAHPAYLETASAFGLALLGHRGARRTMAASAADRAGRVAASGSAH
jgi:hypothetical protein